MDLKKLFPVSYNKGLFVAIISYLVVAVIASLLIILAGYITGWIPVVGLIIGWILRIAGILVDIYVIGGIIVAVLVKLNVIK